MATYARLVPGLPLLCLLTGLALPPALGCGGGDGEGPRATVTRVDPGGITGITGTNVTFEATGTNGAFGYQWNFGGGATPNTSTAAMPTVRLGAPGTYTGTVVPTNLQGPGEPFTFSIVVTEPGAPPSWLVQDADPAIRAVGSTDLAIVNGRLMVAGYDFDNEDLRIAVAQVPFPQTGADWVAYTLDSAGGVGLHASVAEIDGRAMVAYYDFTNGNLKVAHARDLSPNSAGDWRIQVVDSQGDVGSHTSLVEYNGRPAITYQDNTSGALKIARGRNQSPTQDGDWFRLVVDSTLTVDRNFAVGSRSDLAVVADRLTVSYLDTSNDDLLVARLLTPEPAGLGTWQIHTVYGGDVARQTSVVDLRGRAAISFYDREADDLKLARATTHLPTAGTDWLILTVDDSPFVGEFSAMTVQDQRLAISYYDRQNADLRVARALVTEPRELTDWQRVAVDAGSDAGQLTSIVPLGTRLAVSYVEEDNNRLRVATSQASW
ncbi:MAG TPA: hypothetical protein VEI97_20235 [bacterium]|nr:hypothetical protein [bacterium]